MSTPIIQTRSARAFTLVELLVVIGIIALLVAILLPALNKAREEGNSIKCMSNLRMIGQAVAIYESEYNGWLPAGFTGNGVGDTHWDATLQQMMGRSGSIANVGAGNAGMIGQAFTCPSHLVDPSPNGNYECDYSAHPRLMPRIGQTAGGDLYDTAVKSTPGNYIHMHQIKALEIPHSTEVILVADGVQIASDAANDGGNVAGSYGANWSAMACLTGVDAGQYWQGTGPTGPPGRLCINGLSTDYLGSQIEVWDKNTIVSDQTLTPTDKYDVGCIAWRHLGASSANCLFLDGHADSFTVGNKLGAVTLQVVPGGPWGSSPAASYSTNLTRKYLYLPYR